MQGLQSTECSGKWGDRPRLPLKGCESRPPCRGPLFAGAWERAHLSLPSWAFCLELPGAIILGVDLMCPTLPLKRPLAGLQAAESHGHYSSSTDLVGQMSSSERPLKPTGTNHRAKPGISPGGTRGSKTASSGQKPNHQARSTRVNGWAKAAVAGPPRGGLHGPFPPCCTTWTCNPWTGPVNQSLFSPSNP